MKLKYLIPVLLSVLSFSCTDRFSKSNDIQESESNKSYLERASESNTLANQIDLALKKGSRSEQEIYPDYFGGLYIDTEGYLVILSKGDLTVARYNINSISESELISFKPCRFSYQDLLDAMSDLDKNLSVISNASTRNFVGYALMIQDNSIMVLLEDASDAAVAEFKQSVYDNPCLTFVKGERINLHSSKMPESNI